MYSENQEDILARMLSNVPPDIDASEGTFINNALSPASHEIAQQEIILDEISLRVFAETAAENGYSSDLEKKCVESGIVRKSGVAATAHIYVTGADGTYNGILVQTAAGLKYTADIIIASGSGTAIAVAEKKGTTYNVPANSITQFPIMISGLVSVTNTSPATGGTDDESDDALFARLRAKMMTPPASGNANDYKIWALSIDGIGNAKVFPLWNGNGTVKVCLLDSNMQPANESLIEATESYIESVRPIGATVAYTSAETHTINVATAITFESGVSISTVQPVIEQSITNYLKSIAFNQNYVSFAQIGSAILNAPGVLDYTGLLVNGAVGNVNIGDEQVAVLGTVTLNE